MVEYPDFSEDKEPLTREQVSLGRLQETLNALREDKPNDRSMIDRVYAVTITDLEKIMAFFMVYAVDGPAGKLR